MSETQTQRGDTRISVDWGHLLTVMGMGAWALWYLQDLRAVSLDIENTLLVQPLIIVFLAMLVAVLPQCFRKEALPEALKPEKLSRQGFLKILGLMISFAVMVPAMFEIGFDISVFSFCAIALLIGGERRWWVVLLFSAITAVVIIKGYQLLVPFQMPNILLK